MQIAFVICALVWTSIIGLMLCFLCVKKERINEKMTAGLFREEEQIENGKLIHRVNKMSLTLKKGYWLLLFTVGLLVFQFMLLCTLQWIMN
ncbi:MAG: hypothetical protein ABF969_03375 [Sporolactobacillus sp.]